jgi:hypothetical protein
MQSLNGVGPLPLAAGFLADAMLTVPQFVRNIHDGRFVATTSGMPDASGKEVAFDKNGNQFGTTAGPTIGVADAVPGSKYAPDCPYNCTSSTCALCRRMHVLRDATLHQRAMQRVCESVPAQSTHCMMITWHST